MDRHVIIDDRKLFYYTEYEPNEYYEKVWTIFYESTETIKVKKYRFFGGYEEVEVPVELFRIYADSEDTRLSKKWWRKQIIKELVLLGRKEELERGELI